MWTAALVLVLANAVSLFSSDPSRGRVRSLDGCVDDLYRTGVARSSSFRALAGRLSTSDVVVYLRSDRTLSQTLTGQLTFVSNVAGTRYVLVTVNVRAGAMPDRVAALGHELRHAIEVAESPSIVDRNSLAEVYRTIGFESIGRRNAFESAAAIAAGRRVRRELASASAAE